jgi:hypothetical protein
MSPEPGPPGWQSKIDHRLRALLARGEERPREADQSVNVFVRFTGPAQALLRYGVTLRTVAGDIATASIPLREIPRVASAPEILFIELARPLGPDVEPLLPEIEY